MPKGTYVNLPEELKERLRIIAQTGKPRMFLKDIIIEACEEHCARFFANVPGAEETIDRIREAKAGAAVGVAEEG